MSIEVVHLLLPELILAVAATLIYVAGAFIPSRNVWGWIGVAAVVAAALALAGQSPSAAMAGPLAGDLLGQFARWLALLAGLLLVLTFCRRDDDVPQAETIGTLLLAVTGVMLVAGARELVLLFLGLELISIPTYILLYLGRREAASQEAAVKYFFLSILASALTLYGFSFLYGVGRSTDLTAIQSVLAAELAAPTGLQRWAVVALVLIFAGLGFKIAAVPFHFYAPDVYQGTTNANAGVLSVLPKAAGFVAMVRILAVAMPGVEVFGWRLALVLAMLTMSLANVLALWQDNVRRLLAYSSISHAGYMLIGLAVAFAQSGAASTPMSADAGVGAMLFYLATYVVAIVGIFAALAYLGGTGRQIDGIDELAGLGRTHPLVAMCLSLLLFSQAGVPPLAGFWGKFTLFTSALGVGGGDESGLMRFWFIALAVTAGLNAAVAAAYYLRIVGTMYFRTPFGQTTARGGLGPAAAMLACSLLVLGIGIAPGALVAHSFEASRSARMAAAQQYPVPATASVTHVPLSD